MSEQHIQLAPNEIQEQIRRVIPNAKRGQVQQLTQIVQNLTQANFNQINIHNGSNGIDPHVIEQFNAVSPGSGDEFMRQFFSQIQHRQNLEKTVVNANISREKRGQWFTFLITVLALGFGFKLINDGRDAVGYAICLGVIGALALVFIAGRVLSLYQLKLNRQGLQITVSTKPQKKH